VRWRRYSVVTLRRSPCDPLIGSPVRVGSLRYPDSSLLTFILKITTLINFFIFFWKV